MNPAGLRAKFVLTAYGMPHRMGYLPTRDGKPHPKPLTPIELMDAAVEMGLAGVEFPLRPIDLPHVEGLRDALQSRGLAVVTDFMVLVDSDCEAFGQFLRGSARLGAKVTRALISTILCGDRRTIPGGWDARLSAVASRLREVLPLAEELGLCVAVENHQDATADDLVRLHEMSGSSPAYGIVFDTGNPLSVGEDPVNTARRIAPLVRHVHLKDYTIHFAPEGYRLARCAAGEGCIDFPAILQIVYDNGHQVNPGIEIAAQPARTIPLLEDGWWACYPPRHAHDFIDALRVLWKKGRPPHEPYSSAWERGENSDVVSTDEWELVKRSVAYFRKLPS